MFHTLLFYFRAANLMAGSYLGILSYTVKRSRVLVVDNLLCSPSLPPSENVHAVWWVGVWEDGWVDGG